MIKATPFEIHTVEYEAWFDKYHDVYESELLAIKSQLQQLPENIKGIEIGVGTGRYAAPLGIREGVEPAENMAAIARKKGIEIMKGVAEDLPYKDMHFDFVLFVTICHLHDFRAALKEAYRVLNRKGSVIIGFIDKDRPVGISYEAKRNHSTFYRRARFYSVKEVLELLKERKFRNPVINQTLFRDLDMINEVEEPRSGYGEGSFVTVRAEKHT